MLDLRLLRRLAPLLFLCLLLAACRTPPPPEAAAIAPRASPPRGSPGLQAFHRSGQTFLTWLEPGDPKTHYRIYRATTPITSLEGLTPLARVAPGSGTFTRHATSSAPLFHRYIIDPLGKELPAGTGLYVHTPHPAGPEQAWYAVGIERAGRLQPLDPRYVLKAPLTELEATPQPIPVLETPDGLQRLFTSWVDDRGWRSDAPPAYSFWVGRPKEATDEPLPLTVHLHAWGESWRRFFDTAREEGSGTPYGFKTIWLEPDDPGNTWWAGFADKTDRDGNPARDARIVPYTEARLEAILAWLGSPASGYRVDPDRIYLYGGSMGGSGALTFGLRRPDRFAAIYAMTAMTRPGASTWGRDGFERLWGALAHRLPDPDGRPFYDRQDMQALLRAHDQQDLPFTVTIHGRTDRTIEWATQGRPWLEARRASGQPGPALFTDGDHGSVFDSYTRKDLVPNYVPTAYALKRTDSYPVFTDFTGDDPADGPIPACRAKDPLYRYGMQGGGLEWGGTGLEVLGRKAPVDTPQSYEIALRVRSDLCALPDRGTVTVTLRRRQAFRPAPGSRIAWESLDASGTTRQRGTLAVGPGGRVTVPGLEVSKEGALLRLESSPSARLE